MLVCPLQGLGGIQGKECFLRVTSAHLFEVELRAARTLERLELQSLVAAEMESETESPRERVPEVSCGVGGLGRGVCVPGAGLGTFHFPCEYVEPRSALVCCMSLGSGLKDGFCVRAWCQHQRCGARVTVFLHALFRLLPTAVFFPPEQGSGPPPGAPVLVLRFSYICPDRKLRRYAVLEPEAHEAIQVLDPEAGGKSGGSRSRTGGLGSPSSSTCSLPAHS